MFGLSEKTYKKILEITQKYNVQFILFGSRARGDYKENSDIDIAVQDAVDEKMEYKIRNDFDLLDIPYTVDLVFIDSKIKEELRQSIIKEGVNLK